MAQNRPESQDGHLPSALRTLRNAISALIDPKPHTIGSAIHWLDSLYDQLCDGIPGSQGNARNVPQSTPPLCIDAVELKQLIDSTVATWEPRPDIHEDQYLTVIRLQTHEHHPWRPQDVTVIDQHTADLNAWCEAIKSLLNPAPKWHLPNPCPQCNRSVVYRRNSADEIVRQPALQIGTTGCVCQHCHATWEPALFVHLSRVLGYQLPDGCLE